MTTHPTAAEIAESEQRLKQHGWTEGLMSLCAAARDRNRLAGACAKLREAIKEVMAFQISEVLERCGGRRAGVAKEWVDLKRNLRSAALSQLETDNG